MDKRIYKVLDATEASMVGAKTFSNGEFNRFALVAMRGDKLDNVVAWGYNREPLEKKATERNNDIAMLGRMVGKANKNLDIPEGE